MAKACNRSQLILVLLFTAIYIVFAFEKMEKKFDNKGQLFFD